MRIDEARTGRHLMETTIEAAPVQPEPCTAFAGSADDSFVCGCGWLEHDHGELAIARAVRLRGKQPAVALERRAS